MRVPLSLPYTLARARASLLHVNYVLPPVCPCPGVTTVHDLSYALFPDDAPPRDKLVLGRLLPMSVRKAKAVIVVSQNTRKDIVQRFRVPDERINVIYEAAPPHIRRVTTVDELERVRARYGIKGDFVLAVGNLQPRKNLSRLVEAFAVVRRSRVPAQLAIVGQARWRESEAMRLVQERGLTKDVIFTGYVPDADLPGLYSGAAAFAYPSLYEGFGLPVLEAMTCGAPVITSNTSSLPEVAGDAALQVDPTSVRALAEAMQAILTQGDLATRLSQRGLRRAAMFSWERAAQQTLEVYERVLHPVASSQSPVVGRQ
jgi:glycosyltransferase involved in cell wall biosynthesis